MTKAKTTYDGKQSATTYRILVETFDAKELTYFVSTTSREELTEYLNNLPGVERASIFAMPNLATSLDHLKVLVERDGL